GWDVAIDGQTIAVSNADTDTAYVFNEPPGGWVSSVEDATLQVAGESLDAVGVSGGTVVALGNALHVFTEPVGGWSGVQAPVHSMPESGLRSVALDGDRLVAGGAGEAYAYTRDDDGVWSAAAPMTV